MFFRVKDEYITINFGGLIMIKIYTKTGDKGKTSLYDGTRVDKNSTRVESYGTVDELNSNIGFARTYCEDDDIRQILFKIQRSLFNVAGELATEKGNQFPERVTEKDIEWLEQIIDHYLDLMNRDEVFQFIIPGSNHFCAALHISRTVCRRAERRILTLAEEVPLRAELVKYVNRLSDTLYTLARYSETELHRVEFIK